MYGGAVTSNRELAEFYLRTPRLSLLSRRSALNLVYRELR